MPYKILTLENPTGAHVRFTGVVNGAETYEVTCELRQRPENYCNIWDFSGIEGIDLSMKDLFRHSEMEVQTRPETRLRKVAFIGTDSRGQGLAATYIAMFKMVTRFMNAKPWEMRFFESQEEGIAWARDTSH